MNQSPPRNEHDKPPMSWAQICITSGEFKGLCEFWGTLYQFSIGMEKGAVLAYSMLFGFSSIEQLNMMIFRMSNKDQTPWNPRFQTEAQSQSPSHEKNNSFNSPLLMVSLWQMFTKL